jgi:RHS repeat-associated protein
VSYNTATNRITSVNFAYDTAGNQTQSNENGQINNYKYDAAGRLAEVSSNGLTHTYAYGASNQRLQMVEAGSGGSTTLYVWEGGSVIAEYNGVGSGMAWMKSYVYLGGRLLATDSTSGIQYHHPDRLGTRLVTNTSGGIVSENIGLPFGTTINAESSNLAGSDAKKRFTSYDRSDNTKLDYAVNRHYSAAQGRFTQVDPIGMSAVSLSDPQSLNLYAYCGNDPINYTDPSGLFSFKKLFGFIAKALKFIALAIVTAVAIVTMNVPLLVKVALSWVGMFAPGWVGRVASSLGALSSDGLQARFGTPPTFPNNPTGVGGVSSFMQDPPQQKPLLILGSLGRLRPRLKYPRQEKLGNG